VASGIGGGSADAAATLRGLSRLWKQNIADTELLSIAAALGSDVPVCLKSRAAWMEGRGEHVTPLVALPEIPIVLVNPGVGVPTAAVFKALATRRGTGLEYPKAFSGPEELFRFLESTTNDLEAPAMAIAPVISDVIATLKSLPGTRLVRMSGSGATCFALFESADRANGAVQVLAAKHPNWWVRATKTLSHDGSALQ
jgi:4-diphosphocytidyl-2-C-methyl-D-erythritol kinase